MVVYKRSGVRDDLINIYPEPEGKNRLRYFVPRDTYDTITEAVKNMDIVRDCVRIQENKTFTVGRTYKTLSECSEYSQIFDINCSQSVR